MSMIINAMVKRKYVDEWAFTGYKDIDFETALNSDSGNALQEGNVVKGVAIRIDKDYVIVDIGGKMEGRVFLSEFDIAYEDCKNPTHKNDDKNAKQPLAAGDVVSVYVEKVESYADGGSVYARLSRQRAILHEKWDHLESCLENKRAVEGIICHRVKGGCSVDIGGVAAFLPGSQIDIRHVKDIDPLVGPVQQLLIMNMDKKQGNIVVSRRAVLEEDRAERREQLFKEIEVGQVLNGVVKGITDYGVFVNLDCVDGLLHITDISWERLNHPSECERLRHGADIDVKVIGIDKSRQKISLGLKQLTDDPWDGIEDKYPVNSKHTGKVTNIEGYGLFVKLGRGIEGLVHTSQISWSSPRYSVAELNQKFVEGDSIDVQVLSYESSEKRGSKRMSLSIKQLEANPWSRFVEDKKIGDIVDGSVDRKTKDYVYVTLPEYRDIKVRLSKFHLLADDASEEELTSEFRGKQNMDSIRAKIMCTDVENERIYISVMNIDHDVNSYIRTLKVNDVVTDCYIREIDKNVVHIEFGEYLFPARLVLPKNTKAEMRGYFYNDMINTRNLFISAIDYDTGCIVLADDINSDDLDEEDN